MTAEGIVYLLHFERPYRGQMQPYHSGRMVPGVATICGRWLPVWLPEVVSEANVRMLST
jgi:hypothetical protein